MMKKLLEAVTKFAGEPEQKPGDQVKGTDKAKTGGKKHPFLNQLVGESDALKQKDADAALEKELAESYANFNEDEYYPPRNDNGVGQKIDYKWTEDELNYLQMRLIDLGAAPDDYYISSLEYVHNSDRYNAVLKPYDKAIRPSYVEVSFDVDTGGGHGPYPVDIEPSKEYGRSTFKGGFNEYEEFINESLVAEDNLGVEPKRPTRKGARPARGHVPNNKNITEAEQVHDITNYLAAWRKYLDPQIDNIEEVFAQVADYFGPGEIEVMQGGISQKDPGYSERKRNFTTSDRLRLNTNRFKDPKSFYLGVYNGSPAVVFDTYSSEYLITHKENDTNITEDESTLDTSSLRGTYDSIKDWNYRSLRGLARKVGVDADEVDRLGRGDEHELIDNILFMIHGDYNETELFDDVQDITEAPMKPARVTIPYARWDMMAPEEREELRSRNPGLQVVGAPSKKVAKPKTDYNRIMFDIDNAIGQAYPDGEPFDYLSRKYNIEQLDQAVRAEKHGRNFNDYIAKIWDQHMSDNPGSTEYSENPFKAFAEGTTDTKKSKNKRYQSLKNWLAAAEQSGATIRKESVIKSTGYIVYHAMLNDKEIGWFDNFDNVGYLPTVISEASPEERKSNRDLYDKIRSKGVVPGIDRERYTDLSHEGLEGPFRAKNGEVLYYDPKEGKYYNRDDDMYVDYGLDEGALPQHYVDRYNSDIDKKIDKSFHPDYNREMSDQEFQSHLINRSRQNKGEPPAINESNAGIDEMLAALRKGVAYLNKYKDSYTSINRMLSIASNLRSYLMAGDEEGFENAYSRYLGEYPDAMSELLDACEIHSYDDMKAILNTGEQAMNEAGEYHSDPDWAYDQRRQEKADAETLASRKTVKKFYVYDGVQRKAVSPEFDTQAEAITARDGIDLNHNHLSIQISNKRVAETVNEYAGMDAIPQLRDRNDYQQRMKAIQDMQMDPDTAKDPQLRLAVMKKRAELTKQAREQGLIENWVVVNKSNKVVKMFESKKLAYDFVIENIFESEYDVVRRDDYDQSKPSVLTKAKVNAIQKVAEKLGITSDNFYDSAVDEIRQVFTQRGINIGGDEIIDVVSNNYTIGDNLNEASHEFTYAPTEKIEAFLKDHESRPEASPILQRMRNLLIKRAKKELANRRAGGYDASQEINEYGATSTGSPTSTPGASAVPTPKQPTPVTPPTSAAKPNPVTPPAATNAAGKPGANADVDTLAQAAARDPKMAAQLKAMAAQAKTGR